MANTFKTQTQLADTLRGQKDIGRLMMLSGDRALAPVGQSITQDVQDTIKLVQGNKQKEEQRKVLKNYYDAQMKQAGASLAESKRHNIATEEIGMARVGATLASTTGRRSEAAQWKLSQALEKGGFIEYGTNLTEIDKLLAEYGAINEDGSINENASIPGVGGAGGLQNVLPMAMRGAEGKPLAMAMQRIANIILKERSGAAVTTPEMERFQKEFGLFAGGQDSDILRAYAGLKRSFQRTVKNQLGGIQDPSVYQNYKSYTGGIPGFDDSDLFSSAAPEMTEEAELDALLGQIPPEILEGLLDE